MISWLIVSAIVCAGCLLVLALIIHLSIPMPCCPYCGSDRVFLTKIERPGLITWITVHCGDCDHRWSFPDPRRYPK